MQSVLCTDVEKARETYFMNTFSIMWTKIQKDYHHYPKRMRKMGCEYIHFLIPSP